MSTTNQREPGQAASVPQNIEHLRAQAHAASRFATTFGVMPNLCDDSAALLAMAKATACKLLRALAAREPDERTKRITLEEAAKHEARS